MGSRCSVPLQYQYPSWESGLHQIHQRGHHTRHIRIPHHNVVSMASIRGCGNTGNSRRWENQQCCLVRFKLGKKDFKEVEESFKKGIVRPGFCERHTIHLTVSDLSFLFSNSLKGDEKDFVFRGDRTKEEIVHFALRANGPPVQQITRHESLDSLKGMKRIFFVYVGEFTGPIWVRIRSELHFGAQERKNQLSNFTEALGISRRCISTSPKGFSRSVTSTLLLTN